MENLQQQTNVLNADSNSKAIYILPKPKVISFFSGCGGSSLGYKRAGCDVILANDWEQKAAMTYKLNFPETTVLCEDIRNIDGTKLLKQLEINPGELDILDGSPPCTPFSMAGKRERSWNKKYVHVGDSKIQQTNDLFFEFIRMIDEIKPKAFIAENVKGLISGKAKGYFNIILRKMKALDYNVQVLLLNAKDFEVPQSRERIFFIGIRKDIEINENAKMKTYPEISFGEAMQGLKIPENEYKQSLFGKNAQVHHFMKLMKQGETIQRHDPKGLRFNTMRLNNDKPSNTLHCKQDCFIHPIENRKISLAEMKRIASFPDDFKFLTINDGTIRLGNAVPPNLIKHVAKYVLERMDWFENEKRKKIKVILQKESTL